MPQKKKRGRTCRKKKHRKNMPQRTKEEAMIDSVANIAEVCIRPLVEAIHASPIQAVLYISGGASQALGWLLSSPGASDTVLEAVIPYSKISMAQLLGKMPVSFVSQCTVEEMVLLAYNRALKLSKPGHPVVGMAFTGSLASRFPKRGDHRFYLSTRSSNRFFSSTVSLSKGYRTREEEDKTTSYLLLKALAESCNITSSSLPELLDNEIIDEHELLFDEDEELKQLMDGQVCMKIYSFATELNDGIKDRKIILCGSFNPLHEGHVKLLDVASSIYDDCVPCFEISAINADKPPLTISQIKDRVTQFEETGKIVLVSNQPHFYRKAILFPGSIFVVGADTAERLVNPKYYGGEYTKMIGMLSECKSAGCRFLVGGRNVNGVFKVLEDFAIPDALRDICESIPPERFNMNISSTEIRNRGL